MGSRNRKINKNHSTPKKGDYVDDNKNRGTIIDINKQQDYIWVQFKNQSVPIPIFISDIEVVGIESRQQLVWRTTS